MIYKAPTSGFYQISAEVTTYEPTGEFETVSNPARRWWKFWLPKTIVRERYKVVTHNTGSKIVLLKNGETVSSENGLIKVRN